MKQLVPYLLRGTLLALSLAGPTAAQPVATRYWVTLRDKQGVRFDPAAYFSVAAQARRARQHLPAYEASDLPVRADYLRQVQAGVDTVTLVSRWFNAVVCRATPAQAAALGCLPGVLRVQEWPLPQAGAVAAGWLAAPARLLGPARPSAADYLLAQRQTAHLDGPALRRRHLDGSGLRIAVFDVGFSGLRTHPAFAQLVSEKRIAATYDFLRNDPDVFRGGSHGTEVMGCLAGRLPAETAGRPALALGLAPAATYLLARTEKLHGERFAEEEAWLAAAEWADRQGADVINSSLAYTARRYFPEQMNGRASFIARAANLAARKGMLVVSAAGNDGDNDWVRIGTPADADSVLAVGGLDPETGLHIDFSSYGPSADRRPKPNVAAFGVVLTPTPGGGYERLEGTSFASPLVAGLAAAVWQQHRDWTARQLFDYLQQTAELYPYFDYAHGYGRPRAVRLLGETPAPPATEPTFDFVRQDTAVAVIIRLAAATRPAYTLPLEVLDELADSPPPPAELKKDEPTRPKDVAPVGQEQPVPATAPDPQLPAPDYPAYLYWSLAGPRGVLRRYETRAVAQRLVLQVPRRLVQGGEVLRVYYKGYTGTYSE